MSSEKPKFESLEDGRRKFSPEEAEKLRAEWRERVAELKVELERQLADLEELKKDPEANRDPILQTEELIEYIDEEIAGLSDQIGDGDIYERE